MSVANAQMPAIAATTSVAPITKARCRIDARSTRSMTSVAHRHISILGMLPFWNSAFTAKAPVGDDDVTRREAAADRGDAAIRARADLHLAARESRAALCRPARDETRRLALRAVCTASSGTNRRRVCRAGGDDDRREHAGFEPAAAVIDCGAHGKRPRAGVETGADRIDARREQRPESRPGPLKRIVAPRRNSAGELTPARSTSARASLDP